MQDPGLREFTVHSRIWLPRNATVNGEAIFASPSAVLDLRKQDTGQFTVGLQPDLAEWTGTWKMGLVFISLSWDSSTVYSFPRVLPSYPHSPQLPASRVQDAKPSEYGIEPVTFRLAVMCPTVWSKMVDLKSSLTFGK